MPSVGKHQPESESPEVAHEKFERTVKKLLNTPPKLERFQKKKTRENDALVEPPAKKDGNFSKES
jgi:hypothetical protein